MLHVAVDELDRRLIDLLATDGRRAFTDIAVELGVSEATIRTRVSRLTSDGTLRIVALCNPLTLGHQPVRFRITVRDFTPADVARTIADIAMVGHVALIAGRNDIYLEATARDLDQLMTLLDELRQIRGIADIEPNVISRLYKDYSWRGLRNRSGDWSLGGSGERAHT
ncbi:Lrp/AsnC family transcriptional regulator [Pseudoclavibacter helvolus]